MTHKFRTLGIALVAVLAMSAVAASAANATAQLTLGSESGTLTASQLTSQVFTTTPGTVTCGTSHQEGSWSGGKTKTTVTMTKITYSGCKAFGFLSAEVTTTGCEYIFTAGPETKTATVELKCSGDLTVETFGCTIHVPSQKVGGHVTFDNNASDVTATLSLSGITYTETAGCPNAPNTALTHNGTLTGSSTIIAKNTSAEPTSVQAD
jgi:hypothetical protein